MKVEVFSHKKSAIEFFLDHVIDSWESQGRLNLCVATGETMKPVYQEFVRVVLEKSLPLDQLHLYLLDDFYPLGNMDKYSFYQEILQSLVIPLGLSEKQFYYPTNSLEDYEELIKKHGGIDYQLLGLGLNGHIGFNEPPSPLNSNTRVITLAETSKESLRSRFAPDDIPAQGWSRGIFEIMQSRSIYLFVWGDKKSKLIKELHQSPPNENFPASWLKTHLNTYLVLDEEAASKISLNI